MNRITQPMHRMIAPLCQSRVEGCIGSPLIIGDLLPALIGDLIVMLHFVP